MSQRQRPEAETETDTDACEGRQRLDAQESRDTDTCSSSKAAHHTPQLPTAPTTHLTQRRNLEFILGSNLLDLEVPLSPCPCPLPAPCSMRLLCFPVRVRVSLLMHFRALRCEVSARPCWLDASMQWLALLLEFVQHPNIFRIHLLHFLLLRLPVPTPTTLPLLLLTRPASARLLSFLLHLLHHFSKFVAQREP